MAYHKNDFIKRLQAVEAQQRKNERRIHIFNIHHDFCGPSAMRKEFKKAKYRGCLIILNDIR